MHRRLYFLLHSVESAREITNELLLARIDDRHMRFLAKRGTSLGDLPEATYFQKSDVVHGAEFGMVLGGICGALLGVILFFFPPGGLALELGTVLVTSLGGALMGAWIASLVGASIPNSRLRGFSREIEAGKVLLMVDVPLERIEEIRERILRRHPEVDAKGIEPTVPAFP